MNDWTWNGARWWRFDFHTHTPASDDYGKGPDQEQLRKRTATQWMLDYMQAGIDCVVVTDHNTGKWIDLLKSTLSELDEEKPDGYRSITLFPGVEISVNGGVHVLAILPTTATTSDIDSLLGAVGFDPTKKGSSDAVTTKAIPDVAAAIAATGGLAIPAHVDQPRGLFEQRDGQTLKQVLDCDHIFAMEVSDANYIRPGSYSASNVSWTEVVGSDSHHPVGTTGDAFPGSTFTWVKMGEPSIEGLRLALLDGSLSVRRGDVVSEDPNLYASLAIESLEVRNARYLGRGEAFVVQLNPWLNAIIGGRGTGKSTLVEFLRLVLRRESELPDELESEFSKYSEVASDRSDKGLLTPETAIIGTIRKDGTRFRVQWDPKGELVPIEVFGNEWTETEGAIPQRFPVRIYSQKQVFELARRPLALLKVVDEAEQVGFAEWDERWRAEEAKYLSLRAKIREIESQLSESPRLRGELDDIHRKLAVFEKSGHAELLKEYQRRVRQKQTVDEWESEWDDVGERLKDVSDELVPADLAREYFDSEAPEDSTLLENTELVTNELRRISQVIIGLADEATQLLDTWRDKRQQSDWRKAVDRASESYEELKDLLAEQGVDDPSSYGILVQRRQATEKRLAEMKALEDHVSRLETESDECLERLLVLRRELSDRRERFLKKVLEDNPYVRIGLTRYGASENAEEEFRSIVQQAEGGFEKDIGRAEDGTGMVGSLYSKQTSVKEMEAVIAQIKCDVRSLAAGDESSQPVADKRFAVHLAKLQPEALDRLDMWFPEDSLDVRYSTSGGKGEFRPINEGSPGQKTAALLAFLMSYGNEPLILDQPEDDLDNHLIFDLIVTQLREVKSHRQVIVVTHNANIVVNGDAELVAALKAQSGRTIIESIGSLQEKDVRSTICVVMEGGKEAFTKRFERIALEGRHI
jgi:energy-coupling factor transporter ATP-binding protein EcfA2